jgi:hypothetical protein
MSDEGQLSTLAEVLDLVFLAALLSNAAELPTEDAIIPSGATLDAYNASRVSAGPATRDGLAAASHVLNRNAIYPNGKDVPWRWRITSARNGTPRPELMQLSAEADSYRATSGPRVRQCREWAGAILWLWHKQGVYNTGGGYDTLAGWWRLLQAALPRVASALSAGGQVPVAVLERLTAMLCDTCGLAASELPETNMTADERLRMQLVPCIKVPARGSRGNMPPKEVSGGALAERAQASLEDAIAAPLGNHAVNLGDAASVRRVAARLAAAAIVQGPPGQVPGCTLTQAAALRALIARTVADKAAKVLHRDGYISVHQLVEQHGLTHPGGWRVGLLLAFGIVDVARQEGDSLVRMTDWQRVEAAARHGAPARADGPLFVKLTAAAVSSMTAKVALDVQTHEQELLRAALSAALAAHGPESSVRRAADDSAKQPRALLDVRQFVHLTQETFGDATAARVVNAIRQHVTTPGTASAPSEFTTIVHQRIVARYSPHDALAEQLKHATEGAGLDDIAPIQTFDVRVAVRLLPPPSPPSDSEAASGGRKPATAPFGASETFSQIRITAALVADWTDAGPRAPETTLMSLSKIATLVAANARPQQWVPEPDGSATAAPAPPHAAASATSPRSDESRAATPDAIPEAVETPAPDPTRELWTLAYTCIMEPDAVLKWGDGQLAAFAEACGLPSRPDPRAAAVQQLLGSIDALLAAARTAVPSQACSLLGRVCFATHPASPLTLRQALIDVQECISNERVALQGNPPVRPEVALDFVRRVLRSNLLRVVAPRGAAGGSPTPGPAGFAISVVHPSSCSDGDCTCSDDAITIKCQWSPDWYMGTAVRLPKPSKPTRNAPEKAKLHYLAVQLHHQLAAAHATLGNHGIGHPFTDAFSLGARRKHTGGPPIRVHPADTQDVLNPHLAAFGRTVSCLAIGEACAYAAILTKEATARIRALYDACEKVLLQRLTAYLLTEFSGPVTVGDEARAGTRSRRREDQAAAQKQRREAEARARLKRLLNAIASIFQPPDDATRTAELQSVLDGMESFRSLAAFFLEGDCEDDHASTTTSRTHAFCTLMWVPGLYEPYEHLHLCDDQLRARLSSCAAGLEASGKPTVKIGEHALPYVTGPWEAGALPNSSSFISEQMTHGDAFYPPGPNRPLKTDAMVFLSEKLPHGAAMPAGARVPTASDARGSTHVFVTPSDLLHSTAGHLATQLETSLKNFAANLRTVRSASGAIGTLSTQLAKAMYGAPGAKKREDSGVVSTFVQDVMGGRKSSGIVHSVKSATNGHERTECASVLRDIIAGIRGFLGALDSTGTAGVAASAAAAEPKKVNRAILESARPRVWLLAMLSRALARAVDAVIKTLQEGNSVLSGINLASITSSVRSTTLPPEAQAALPSIEVTAVTAGLLADRAIAWGDYLARAPLKLPLRPVAVPGRQDRSTGKRDAAQLAREEAARLDARRAAMASMRAEWERDRRLLSFGGQPGLAHLLRDGLGAQAGWYPSTHRRNPATAAQLLNFVRIFNLSYILRQRAHDCVPSYRVLVHPVHVDVMFYTPYEAVQTRDDTRLSNGSTIGYLEYLRLIGDKAGWSHIGVDPGVSTLAAATTADGIPLYMADTADMYRVRDNRDLFDEVFGAEANAAAAKRVSADLPSAAGPPQDKRPRPRARRDDADYNGEERATAPEAPSLTAAWDKIHTRVAAASARSAPSSGAQSRTSPTPASATASAPSAAPAAAEAHASTPVSAASSAAPRAGQKRARSNDAPQHDSVPRAVTSTVGASGTATARPVKAARSKSARLAPAAASRRRVTSAGATAAAASSREASASSASTRRGPPAPSTARGRARASKSTGSRSHASPHAHAGDRRRRHPHSRVQSGRKHPRTSPAHVPAHAHPATGAAAAARAHKASALTKAILGARSKYVRTRYRAQLLRKVAKEMLKAAAAAHPSSAPQTGASARRERIVVLHVGSADFSSSYRGLRPFAARGFRKVLAVVAIACRGMGGVTRFLTVHTVEFASSKHCHRCGQQLVTPVRLPKARLQTRLAEEHPTQPAHWFEIAAKTLANKEVRAVKFCPTCNAYVPRDTQAAANIAKTGVAMQKLARHNLQPQANTYLSKSKEAEKHRGLCVPVPRSDDVTLAAAKAAVACRRPLGLRTPSGIPMQGVLDSGKLTPEEHQRVNKAVARAAKKAAKAAAAAH